MSRTLGKILQRLTLSAAILVAAITLYYINRSNLEPVSRHHSINIPYAGSVQQSMRLVLLADLHIADTHLSYKALEKLGTEIRAAGADIILLAGDYTRSPTTIDAIKNHASRTANLLAGFSNAPIIAVLGNYEYAQSPGEWVNALTQKNIPVLENDILRVKTARGPVCIRGFGDTYSNRFNYIDFPPDCRYLPKITMTHDPAGAFHDQVQGLVFAGHTHCGQISLPLIGPIWVPTDAPKNATCGWYEDEQRRLFVTSGTGYSILPLRLGAEAAWDIMDITFTPR